MDEKFTVKFSHKGKSISVENISHETTAAALLYEARSSFAVDNDIILRLIFKGKTIAQESISNATADNADTNINRNNHPAFQEGTKIPKSGAKVIVMGTAATNIQKLNSSRSDPLMRGFDDEKSSKATTNTALSTYWGPLHTNQNKQYKFCRFQECTDASFGSRPGASTPHAFEARRLLERLATDPGIVSILISRELIVGTLGEMDPIDDRLMQKKQQEGGCLLGYNTNHGMRIDVKLRTEDLSDFRPYSELAATVIHELSHNWVGDHNVLFWTNYGNMRVEYLWKHACLMQGGVFVKGKRTATLAGVAEMISPNNNGNIVQGSNSNTSGSKTQTMGNICQSVINELAKEMAQHRIPVQFVAPAVLTFGKELMMETKDDATLHVGGHRLGSEESSQSNVITPVMTSARERALAAAEKRASEARDKSG